MELPLKKRARTSPALFHCGYCDEQLEIERFAPSMLKRKQKYCKMCVKKHCDEPRKHRRRKLVPNLERVKGYVTAVKGVEIAEKAVTKKAIENMLRERGVNLMEVEKLEIRPPASLNDVLDFSKYEVLGYKYIVTTY